MALATPSDREFKVLSAGFIRDQIVLANMREGMRAQVNPETGEPLTEEDIARAFRAGTRWYNEAQAIDDFGQQDQRNALYLADQIKLDRATGKWLLDFHGKLWDADFLSATGGSGPVKVPATAGTIVVGSTTVPDDGAYKARDPAGNLYQVFETATVDPITGFAIVTMVAISTGSGTNPPDGTILTWTQRDPNMAATATVDDDFTGGTDQETEAELADRIASIIQFRPGAGNDAHRRAWARESSNAVEDGFVYPTALHAGSVIVAVTQKRKKALGPAARIASPSTLATAIGYLTPPTSPVAPQQGFTIATTVVSEPSDLVIQLGMQRSSKGGWRDAQPFPAYHATTPFITSVTSQLNFQIRAAADLTLPGQAGGVTLQGNDAPKMMVWNQAKSAWEELVIASVQDLGASLFKVLLVSAPTFALQAGQWVSPAAGRASIVSGAMQDYFDELGPGDFFDVDHDPRGARCVRFPSNLEQWPTDAGDTVVQRIIDAFGGTVVNGNLASISKTTPSFQAAFQNGPNMLTLGNAAIYAL